MYPPFLNIFLAIIIALCLFIYNSSNIYAIKCIKNKNAVIGVYGMPFLFISFVLGHKKLELAKVDDAAII